MRQGRLRNIEDPIGRLAHHHSPRLKRWVRLWLQMLLLLLSKLLLLLLQLLYNCVVLQNAQCILLRAGPDTAKASLKACERIVQLKRLSVPRQPGKTNNCCAVAQAACVDVCAAQLDNLRSQMQGWK